MVQQASVITLSHHSASHHSAEERETGWQHDEDVALMHPDDRSGRGACCCWQDEDVVCRDVVQYCSILSLSTSANSAASAATG